MLIYFQGTFRLACEHVLKTLKKGRETLLTLLEAFVYDPLVDWAVGEDTVTTGQTAGNNGTDRNRLLITGLGCSTTAGLCKDGSNMENALGSELRQAHKQLQHEVTRDTLAIHFTEITPDWLQNRSVSLFFLLFHFTFVDSPDVPSHFIDNLRTIQEYN